MYAVSASQQRVRREVKDNMKITGYRCLRTFHVWGRPVGDVNGFIDSGVTEVPILLLETDEGVTGVGTGSVHDIERLFPAIEGEDPRAVTALYDRMLARVFKTGHAGATFGGIGTLDMAIWDATAKIAAKPLFRDLTRSRIDFQGLNGLRSRTSAIEDVETAWATAGLFGVPVTRHSALRIIDLGSG